MRGKTERTLDLSVDGLALELDTDPLATSSRGVSSSPSSEVGRVEGDGLRKKRGGAVNVSGMLAAPGRIEVWGKGVERSDAPCRRFRASCHTLRGRQRCRRLRTREKKEGERRVSEAERNKEEGVGEATHKSFERRCLLLEPRWPGRPAHRAREGGEREEQRG